MFSKIENASMNVCSHEYRKVFEVNFNVFLLKSDSIKNFEGFRRLIKLQEMRI